jgi:hypothetical protein
MLNWVCVPRVERGRVGLAGRGMPAGFVLVETVIAIGWQIIGTGDTRSCRSGSSGARGRPPGRIQPAPHVFQRCRGECPRRGMGAEDRNRNSTDVRCTETVIISSPGAPALAGVQPQQPRSE